MVVPVELTRILLVPYPAFKPRPDDKLAAVNAAVEVNTPLVVIVSDIVNKVLLQVTPIPAPTVNPASI